MQHYESIETFLRLINEIKCGFVVAEGIAEGK